MEIRIFKNGETLEMGRERSAVRINILMLIFLILGLLVLGRLFQKQVLERNKYIALAESQHNITQEVPAHRGRIFFSGKSENETYLAATNLPLYSVSVVPRQVRDKGGTARKIASILGITEKEIFDEINNDKPYIPPIKQKLEYPLAEKLSSLDLTGVYVLPEEWRYYPENSLAAHVLGYMDTEKKGLYGIEGYFNNELSGDSGKFYAEKDVFGRYITVTSSEKSLDGKDIVLSIDRSVQYYAENLIAEALKAYGAKSGEIVVMDPKSGKILAMAASPSYDPNSYSAAAGKDGTGIFNNPAVSKVYEPGSVFKPLVMAAAIDAGAVTPATEDYFGAYVEVGKDKIWDALKVAYGRQNMSQVLETSNNVGMVYVAQKLGKKPMYEYLKNFGLGKETGIELSGEVSGRLPTPAEMREVDAATISFGQGVSVTDLQMVSSYGALVNGGTMMKPHIVDRIVDPNVSEPKEGVQKVNVEVESTPIKSLTARYLNEMMVSVVEVGHSKTAAIPGYKIGGKTGTAQIPVPGGYSETRTIQSFVGFGPANDPSFLVLVKLSEPNTKWAESSAAPVFATMMKFLLNYYQVPPTR